MDQLFLQAPLRKNAPLQMALAGLANRSVLGYATLAITPYDSRLMHLVPWAQQLEMESLGKVATRDGTPAGVPTGPVVWGMPGTDCQHTRSEEHTSELQSLMRSSYAVLCLKKQTTT